MNAFEVAKFWARVQTAAERCPVGGVEIEPVIKQVQELIHDEEKWEVFRKMRPREMFRALAALQPHLQVRDIKPERSGGPPARVIEEEDIA